MSSLTTPEAELRALGSLRRQCLFAVTILLVEDSRTASEAIRLYAAESGAARAPRRQPACGEPAPGDLSAERGDGRPRAARRRRHGADPPPRLGLDADRRHHRAERPRARRLAGRGDAGRRRGLSGEADRQPQGVPGMRARGAARCREPPPARRARADAGRAGVGRRSTSGRPAPRPGADGRRGSRRGCRDHRLLRAVSRLGRRDARRPRPLTLPRAPRRRRTAPRGWRRCSTGGSAGPRAKQAVA